MRFKLWQVTLTVLQMNDRSTLKGTGKKKLT